MRLPVSGHVTPLVPPESPALTQPPRPQLGQQMRRLRPTVSLIHFHLAGCADA